MVMDWPAGISDGLTLPCVACRLSPKFDYTVSDDIWNTAVPKELRRDVLCLPCLDRMAHSKGIDISAGLIQVQFTGIGKTIILRPDWTHHYEAR